MKSLLGLCCATLLCLIETSGESDTYRGAVVEYFPVLSKDEEARVASNVKEYVNFMEVARLEGVDIIVFPENGLLTRNIQSPIPDPADRISPCDSTTFVTTEAVKKLSCASKDNRIYSVVNLLEKRACNKDDKNCPPRGYYIYNTNVGFDRMGIVVARYSKFNLYDEPLVNKTESPEMATFDTDFNVRFGMFTCFDIMFPAPALKLVQERNVTDFVYTTHWYSELPFLTALQTQRGWAESNNVNFLASGVNYPLTATFGSGIYNGKFGDLIQIMPEVPTRSLLVADIPKIRGSKTLEYNKKLYTRIIPSDITQPDHTEEDYMDTTEEGVQFLRDHTQLFQSEIIETGKKFDKKMCTGDNFCCEFQVSMISLNSYSNAYTTRAIVFNGIRKFGATFTGGVQGCGVVLCDGPDIKNCTSRVKNIPEMFKFTEIRLKGYFQLGNSFQMPTTLAEGEKLEPLTANKYKFQKVKKDKMEVSLELLWPVTNLQTFGIWGRDFSRDMKSNGPAVMSSPALFLSLVFTLMLTFTSRMLTAFGLRQR